MFYANIFNPKVINNEAKLDRPPFVTPESSDGGRFVVTFCFKAFSKEIVSQDARLWQAITSAVDFEVYPAISVPSLEVLFFDAFFGDVRDFDVDIFRVFHWCVQEDFF